ncbi:hypothetical protein Ddye_021682 [Dipteronia dyeriana]|uniref:Uncharacterized protein n=1 Tax=Dipteronia dyeriana TaxID=168575 RepID=A0AAD9WXZ0_9ROSI|nr:hypothetical protein Ddye_021682 [Dipteronia dyeriana]
MEKIHGHIPDHLILDLLRRLPAKSLIKPSYGIHGHEDTRLHVSSHVKISSDDNRYGFLYGFGCDHSTDDYMIVGSFHNHFRPMVEIYYRKTDSWLQIKLFPLDFWLAQITDRVFREWSSVLTRTIYSQYGIL